MSAEQIGPRPERRPERPSKPKGSIADPAARAASARLAASRLTARFGRVWRTFHFIYEELSTHGRYRGTFTILGITASALGKPEAEVTGWERNDTLDDVATLEELGVLWYWPATGRGQGRWAMVEFPPVPGTEEEADEQPAATCPVHGTHAGCFFAEGSGWIHGARVTDR